MKGHLQLIKPKSQDRPARPVMQLEEICMAHIMEGRRVPVLEDISFTIRPGELICLLGPSGCGKTTLLNIIAGFTEPESGQIRIGGAPINGSGPDRCMVFQEDALFPWLTVGENIAFGLRGRLRRSRIQERVDHYLNLVGLKAFRNYLPRELSGGMKQRVALARVLILNPPVLLMDEPFGALDAQTREDMQELLLDIRREVSHAIVFVTHDINEAVTLADRIHLMGKHPGCIAADVVVSLPLPRSKTSLDFQGYYARLREMLKG